MNLRKTLEWLNSITGIDVVIVEQDKYSKIDHLNLKAKHIFIKSDKPYNRSWAFNVALKRNTNPIIIFGDSDIILDPNHLVEAINKLQEYDVVSPYKSVLDLTAEESNMQFQLLPSISRPGRGETDNQKINLCGGIVLFRADSITKIGGWCESFEGWGGEDNFQTYKIDMLGLKSCELPYRCYHFYHQREQSDMTNYPQTLQMLQQLMSLDLNTINHHINSTLPIIGMLNKYS
jgi:hypothetical protein